MKAQTKDLQMGAVENPLPWGKIQKYESSIIDDAWRIGTIGEGSCFFHSILTAVDKSYRKLDGAGARKVAESDRRERVRNIRRKLSKKLTTDNWERLQGGEPAHLEITSKLRETEKHILKTIRNPERYRKSKSRKWILTVLNNDSLRIAKAVLVDSVFDMTEFTSACKEEEGYKPLNVCKSTFIVQETKCFVACISSKIKTLMKEFDDAKIEKAVLQYRNLLGESFNLASKMALSGIREDFQDPNSWIGTEYLVYLSDQFDVNIIIISGETGLPYITGDTSYFSVSRPTIFLLAVNESHYECIASLVGGGVKTKISCKYKSNGKIVKKIMALLDPDKARKEYPEMAAIMHGEDYESDHVMIFSDSESDSVCSSMSGDE